MAILCFTTDLHLIQNLFVGRFCNLLQVWQSMSILCHLIMREILSLIIQEEERKKQEIKFDQLTLHIEKPEIIQNVKQEKSDQSIIIIDIL